MPVWQASLVGISGSFALVKLRTKLSWWCLPKRTQEAGRIWFKHQTRLHIRIGKIDQYSPKKITYLASVFGFLVIGTVLASIGSDLLASLGSSAFSEVVEWSEMKCGAGNFFLLNIKTTALKVLSSSRSIVNRMFTLLTYFIPRWTDADAWRKVEQQKPQQRIEVLTLFLNNTDSFQGWFFVLWPSRPWLKQNMYNYFSIFHPEKYAINRNWQKRYQW